MLWPHSHAIANHFPIGHPSFHYSSSSTLNSSVLSGCAPEKINHWDEVVVTNDLQMDEGEDDNEEDDQEVDHRNRANKNVISWDVGLVYAEP
uniref:Uncharacterized protein n=1 Tax=Brassica oleracea var. oleracea TaxID=109376 RepID=A0A0D3AVJ1_BRAOL